MKLTKILQKGLGIGFMSLTLFSCAWTPKEDYSKVTDKITYKKFTEVEEPIVIQTPVTLSFYNPNNEKVFSPEQIVGNLLVVYDWKNDAVFDYVYAAGRHYPNQILLTQKSADGATSFYSYDTNNYYIYEMNSNATELKKTKKADDAGGYPNNYGFLQNEEILNLVKKGQQDPENCEYQYLGLVDSYHYVCKYLYESGDGEKAEEMSVLVVNKDTKQTETIALPKENARYPLALQQLNGHNYLFVKGMDGFSLSVYEIKPAELSADFLNKKDGLWVEEFVVRQNKVFFAGKYETKPTVYSWDFLTNKFSENRVFVMEDLMD